VGDGGGLDDLGRGVVGSFWGDVEDGDGVAEAGQVQGDAPTVVLSSWAGQALTQPTNPG
jgi:hypothetical protein